MSSMMASFHQAKPVDPHSVLIKKPVTPITKTPVPAVPAKPQKATETSQAVVTKKKKKVKVPDGALSVEVKPNLSYDRGTWLIRSC